MRKPEFEPAIRRESCASHSPKMNRAFSRKYASDLTAPSKIWGNAIDFALDLKNVDTTVDAARLEARATKRKVGTRIFMARAWVIGPKVPNT